MPFPKKAYSNFEKNFSRLSPCYGHHLLFYGPCPLFASKTLNRASLELPEWPKMGFLARIWEFLTSKLATCMNMPLWPQTYHFGSFLVILCHFGHTGHSGHFGQYWPILANIAEIHKMAILFSTFFRKKSYDKENDVFF